MLQEKYTISFSGHKKEWDDFRLVCKLQDRNASAELRKYIQFHLQLHEELLEKYKLKQKEEQENNSLKGKIN